MNYYIWRREGKDQNSHLCEQNSTTHSHPLLRPISGDRTQVTELIDESLTEDVQSIKILETQRGKRSTYTRHFLHLQEYNCLNLDEFLLNNTK